MVFLVIFYGSCISNNIIVRKIQAVLNSVMKLGAPQNVGNFFISWGIISSQEGVTIVSCNTEQMQSTTMTILDTMVTKCLGVLQTYTFFCFTGLCCGFTKILQESNGTTLHHHQAMLAVSFEAGSMPVYTSWQGSTNIPVI